MLVLENSRTAIYAPRTAVQFVEDSINIIGKYIEFNRMIADCHATLEKRFQSYTILATLVRSNQLLP